MAAPNPARAFNSGCPSPEDVSSIGLGWGEGLEENIQEALDRADAAGLLGPPVPSGRGGLDTGWSRPLGHHSLWTHVSCIGRRVLYPSLQRSQNQHYRAPTERPNTTSSI